ncbi:MAG: exodeoxyribonuclease III [Clostridia bacterium]|nr:exodeoxyribonuclease III [Clostridia bacterium]
MKMISWNVNGLRACVQKGFLSYLDAESPDIMAVQETKMRPEQADFSIGGGYHAFWNSAEKKGYSGTAVFAKAEPLNVVYGIGLPEHDAEGRAITLEYPDFYFVNGYTPNAQDGLRRIRFRSEWEDALLLYLKALDERKPLVYCGDLNVAHTEIDLKNPGPNRGNPGFSDEERGMMTRLLDSGFADTFRRLYPDKTDAYSWWSFRAAARERNVGWRIDYFIVSERYMPRVRDSLILSDIFGSDHCPVCLLTED